MCGSASCTSLFRFEFMFYFYCIIWKLEHFRFGNFGMWQLFPKHADRLPFLRAKEIYYFIEWGHQNLCKDCEDFRRGNQAWNRNWTLFFCVTLPVLRSSKKRPPSLKNVDTWQPRKTFCARVVPLDCSFNCYKWGGRKRITIMSVTKNRSENLCWVRWHGVGRKCD